MNAVRATGHDLQPFDIVLINTAAGAAHGRPEFLGRGGCIGREATHRLMNKGVRTVSCLPVKIRGGSAGWCRAVALFQ